MRLALAALLLAGAAAPLLAQTGGSLPDRVDRLEHEMHAVQRKVFPGGNPDYFEPQIAPPAAPPAEAGTPASSAITDLTGRVTALEQQLAQITNQTEENSHKLDLLQQQLDKVRGDTEFRLNALETQAKGATPPAADTGAAPADAAAPPFGPAGRKPIDGGAPHAADHADHEGDKAAAPGPAASPAPDKAAAEPAPSTGDPAEDAYMAGYKLWADKRYPDAEAQLKKVVAQYPDSRRASFAQNLLGRAYFDDGQYASAAEAFLANYRKNPRGERAPDSLYFLGASLTKLHKEKQACQAYQEFDDVYGTSANATLKAKVKQGRLDAHCGA